MDFQNVKSITIRHSVWQEILSHPFMVGEVLAVLNVAKQQGVRILLGR